MTNPAIPSRGAFISFDGVEGGGKSTQAARLADGLRREGHDVVLTREPGGTELGRALRRMLLEDDFAGLTAETELLLYLADRAEHVRRSIQPALDRGAIVIADRFSDSTIAYQSFGRGLPLEMVRRLDAFARGGVMPSLTFFLDLPPEEGLKRARELGPADRLEREAIEFHERVRAGFRAIASSEPERVIVLDARLDVAELARRIADETRVRLSRGG
jgi:dTMP kinase